MEGNTSAEVVLKFGDGKYLFKLGIKQLDELQRLCNAGIGDIVLRVTSGRPWVRDVYETIRLGAIGGGTPAVNAAQLVEVYVDGCALANPDDPASPLATAKAILQAMYFGLSEIVEEGDPNAGKDEAATTPVG